MPIFQPSQFSSDYIDNTAQFDLGISYLFERGKKRQHRLQAAKDVTAVTRSQVADNERSLTFNVASQFINVELAESTLELATQDLKSFQNTVDIGEARYKAGDIGEDDLLKIKLQMLQFQTDVSAAQLARVQGLSDLRQLLGYESMTAGLRRCRVIRLSASQGQPGRLSGEGLAEPGRTCRRRSRESLPRTASTNCKRRSARETSQVNSATRISVTNNISLFGQIQLPIFDRNQGEIARTGFAITQAQEQEKFANGQVLTDVRDAFENLRSNDQIVGLYRSGYLDEAQQSRDISEYAYRHGAASLLDFLDAERSYRATQLGYRQALASYLLALEQLREAVGTRSLP